MLTEFLKEVANAYHFVSAIEDPLKLEALAPFPFPVLFVTIGIEDDSRCPCGGGTELQVLDIVDGLRLLETEVGEDVPLGAEGSVEDFLDAVHGGNFDGKIIESAGPRDNGSGNLSGY